MTRSGKNGIYKTLTIILFISTAFLGAWLVLDNIDLNNKTESLKRCSEREGGWNKSLNSCELMLDSCGKDCNYYLNACYEREAKYQVMLNSSFDREDIWRNETYYWNNSTKEWCLLYNQMMDLYNDQTEVTNSCLSSIGSSARYNKMSNANCEW